MRLEDLENLRQRCVNPLKTKTSGQGLTLSELRAHLVAFISTLHAEIDSHKQDVQLYNEALTQLSLLSASGELSSGDEDCLSTLIGLLQRPAISGSSQAASSAFKDTEESDMSESEQQQKAAGEFRKQFPFRQTYD